MSTKRFNIGDEVHWTDPEGACSGNGVIAECCGDSATPQNFTYLIQKKIGGEVRYFEAFEHEIREAEVTEVEE